MVKEKFWLSPLARQKVLKNETMQKTRQILDNDAVDKKAFFLFCEKEPLYKNSLNLGTLLFMITKF